MHINYPILISKRLSLYELTILQLIKQNKIDDLSKEIEQEIKGTQTIEKLLNIDYIEFIKGKKGQSQYQTIRTTKLGNTVLEDIETAEINTDDIALFEWLESIYKSMDKETGNKRKCKNFIAQFRANSGICRNHLAFLCKTFIDDESQMEYSNKLEFLFFKGANLFSTKFDIYQSRLFQYYDKRKEYFESEFLKIKND